MSAADADKANTWTQGQPGPTPTICQYSDCDSHAVPGQAYCGREDHRAATDDSDGATDAGPDNATGYGDGTDRARTVRWKNRGGAKDSDELRVIGERAPGVVTVRGLALVYERQYVVRDMFGEFVETVARGAAGNCTRGNTVFLFDHDGIPLARTTSGTLRLQDTRTGLAIEADLDVQNNTLANDVVAAIERQDLAKMSFAFLCGKDGDSWNENMTRRTILRFASVHDVSAVTYPANPYTSIDVARSPEVEAARAAHRRLHARGDRLRLISRRHELSRRLENR